MKTTKWTGSVIERFVRYGRRSLFLAALVVALAFACPPPAQAGGVVSTCDELSFRAALTGGGTVTFSCSGTITLTTTNGGTIKIFSDTTIDGSGQNVTISGGHAVEVFSVPSGVELNLNKLTVANGSADFGGGIENRGTLTVTHSTFSGNSATFGGGIINLNGTLTVTHSTFSGNSARDGGAIRNDGTAMVTDSTFSRNNAPCILNVCSGGGGIFNFGTLTVTNSTFSGNTAFSVGGGILNEYTGTLTVTNSTFAGNSSNGGGGIENFGGTVTVTKTTLSGNTAGSAGGGILNQTFLGASTLTVTNSTFAGNSGLQGGGIFNESALTVTNSTFADNSARLSGGGIFNFGATATLRNTIVASSPSGGNCSGLISNGGGNLSWPDTSCPGINSDPKLGPLQDNGGPTQTMALLPGSPAIDAAVDANCPPTDQRGVPRPQGPHCDIGAYEAVICDNNGNNNDCQEGNGNNNNNANTTRKANTEQYSHPAVGLPQDRALSLAKRHSPEEPERRQVTKPNPAAVRILYGPGLPSASASSSGIKPGGPRFSNGIEGVPFK